MFRSSRQRAGCLFALVFISTSPRPATAQQTSSAVVPPVSSAQPPDHQQMDMAMPTGWQFMQDGVLFGVFNDQSGPRGDSEFKAPNWWMGMATRTIGQSRLTLNGMFSLDPATVGKDGYSEIFQVGEALNGRPLIDRQHPHDLFMQLAAIWRIPVASGTGFTIAGGPAGEPALGPVAFMHRASAAEYPFAPLSHHTFDSTHIAYGVVTAATDHGPFVIEGSVFNGREPDENRWDFDFGRLDSVSARLWFKPTDQWEFQVSTGHLKHPEALEPGDIQRTTASGSWMVRNGDDFTAVTVGYGINVTDEATRHAVFGEATRHIGENSVFARAEAVQVEADLLLNDAIPVTPEAAARKDTVGAFTIGGVRDLTVWRGFEGGLGAAVTFYAVPDALKMTHGDHPVSFQVYFRIRPPVGKMGRMWNMRMSQPMAGHSMQ
jgi:hypothetical protein